MKFALRQPVIRPPGLLLLRPSPPPNGMRIPVTSKIAVVAVNGRPIVEIGNDQDVGFVISRACLYPSLYFARIIGSSHVGVSPCASNLKAAEFVYQNDVEHTRNRVGSINSRSAILQNFDAVDHREWNQVDVHAKSICVLRDAFPIDQDQGFLGQKAAKVGCDGAVTAIGDVLVDRSARFNRQFVEQVRLVNDAQLLKVFRAVGVHRIWAGLFRRRNIRAGDNDTLGRRFSGRLPVLPWAVRRRAEGLDQMYLRRREVKIRRLQQRQDERIRF